ncbi:MAG: porin [Xanthobacteraceae bacterium]|nr:porin [Xanthobacteraceae bacterium]
MKKQLLCAAAALSLAGFAGAAYADEVSDLKTEAKALQRQNEELNKRLAAIEKRQKLLDARAADLSMPVKAAPIVPVDDSLCWKGICAYGVIDVGYGWQAHGMPYNALDPSGVNEWLTKGNNRATFAATPNGLSQSTIGLKGSTELLPGLNGIFKIETGFNPMSGTLPNGEASIYQNNGLTQSAWTANGDSSRNGQAFNGQAYVGLSSPLYGTVTIGRNNSFLLDEIIAYDPNGASYAFSPIGFSGTFGGGGSTEVARLDQSIKWTWNYGPVHAGVLYQVGNYGNSGNSSWVHDDLQGTAGFSYQGLSVDATGARIRGMINGISSPLSATQQAGALPAFGPNSLAATLSDNTDAMVTAKYKFTGPVKLEVMAGYEWMQFANPSNPANSGFVSNYGTTFSFVNNAAYPNDKILQMAWIGAKWQATDHLVVQGAYYHYWQNSYGNGAINAVTTSAPAGAAASTTKTSFGVAGCSSNYSPTCSGYIDSASLVLDYVFTKHFDMYAGVMYTTGAGGLVNGYLNSWNVSPTAGARYSF